MNMKEMRNLKWVRFIPLMQLLLVNGIPVYEEQINKELSGSVPEEDINKIKVGIMNLRGRLAAYPFHYRTFKRRSFDRRYLSCLGGGGGLQFFTPYGKEIFKTAYFNFLKAFGYKLEGSWDNYFHNLSLFGQEIKNFIHPVLYIGAQFELWNGRNLKFPLPSHLVPTRMAMNRALIFKLKVDKIYKNHPEAISFYIQNYLSTAPIPLRLLEE